MKWIQILATHEYNRIDIQNPTHYIEAIEPKKNYETS